MIGVIDVRGGMAVHARRGDRDRYQRVAGGDPVALAQRYIGEFGVPGLYVADLDAILGGPAQHPVTSSLAALGAPVWLDAGVSSPARARDALAAGATQVVVGLETLTSYAALAGICADIGGERVAFSLDLRDGTPIGAAAGGESPARIAARAAGAGAAAIIVLDLWRVGAEGGVDLDLLARVREAVPDRMLLAGGGVRGLDDLEQLADAGCDGALVATALHTGRLGAAEVEAARHFSVRR